MRAPQRRMACYPGFVGRQVIPFGMFDVERSAREAKRFGKMDSIYHRGQALAWDGREVLDGLFAKHGTPQLSAAKRQAMLELMSTLMWGEMGAWKIAAQLSDELEPLEARMAAVSQAHDEARHFYVLHDYMERAFGKVPKSMPPSAEKLLASVMRANTPAKKVLGMQLQLEPTALCIFNAVRSAEVCPILTELLKLFEKDEARHVGLGVQLLPSLMKRMSVSERLVFTAYSFKVATWSVQAMVELDPTLRALGLDPRAIAILGKSKQLLALEELWASAPGTKSQISQQIGNAFDAWVDWKWPSAEQDLSVSGRAVRVAHVLQHGMETIPTSLDPTA